MQAATYPKIGQAVFAVDGAKAYPDATGTRRLSYGAVKGYMEDGKKIPPYTYVAGLYERAAQHNNQRRLRPGAEVGREPRRRSNPKMPFNFVSTNDIVGGNSGSAVVNKKGELVGLIFDGNIQSLPGYVIYQEPINRAVSVDSRLHHRGAPEGLQGRRAGQRADGRDREEVDADVRGWGQTRPGGVRLDRRFGGRV